MKKTFSEFRDFAIRGNITDMAIGVALGGAVGKVVTSFVTDVIMPPIGLLIGKVDFANLFISLSEKQYSTVAQAQAVGVPTINYGLFINTFINLLIIAFVVFIFSKRVNKLREEVTPPAVTKKCPFCASAISIEAKRCPLCTSELDK
ncbi:MAG: large conductance mechanosensitive channel protein MscL [Candidatus Paceibacterota bacterium]